MSSTEIFMIILGTMTSIISFFLKKSMDDLKEVKNLCFETKIKVQMIEVDYLNKLENHNQKFDTLNQTMRELTTEIKALRNKIQT